MKFNLGKIILI